VDTVAKGRPKSNRPCRKDGRLEPLIDKGNVVVQACWEAFKVFQDGKTDQQVHDPIGRAWAVGLLDGTTQDAAMLRDIGRRYAQLHGIVYRQTQCAVADHDRVRGTGAGNDNDHTGERFAKLDQLARDAGSKQRLAMQKLCLSANPDEDPLWLGRLIAWERIVGALDEKPIPPFMRDHMILTQAVQALVAMVEG